MTKESITSTVSFQARLLRSERWRASLLGFVWGMALIATVARRVWGGEVMAVSEFYYLTLCVLGFAVVFQISIIFDTRRRMRTGKAVPAWRWLLSAAFDLAVPLVALCLLQVFSPRGDVAAISAPAMLGLPMVTMLSILRLRPAVSLWTGVAAGVSHWALVVYAIRAAGVDSSLSPVLFMYGFFLMVGGVVAAAISWQARAYVRGAVDDAVAVETVKSELLSIEHDLNVARDIQRGLMPSGTPDIKGFDIAGMARPAQQTGGDYYDWQMMVDGRLVVVLADVTGHGIGPALVMAVCRAYARATAPTVIDASILIARINALIYEDLAMTGRFITMVIAVLSPDGSVELVSAGHGPTLLHRRGTGEVKWFGGDGLPLGIDPQAKYGPHQKLQLEKDDVLLLLTDGFMEWARRGDHEQFGMERLKQALSDSAAGSAKAILQGLDSAVQKFAEGQAQNDDTTAVAIKRT